MQQVIDEYGPDVIGWPEAYNPNEPGAVRAVLANLELAGYATNSVEYGDTDGRKDVHVLAGAARGPVLKQVEVLHLGPETSDGGVRRRVGRAALRFCLEQSSANQQKDDPPRELDVIIAHLDDRYEKTRLLQAQALLEQIAPGRPTVIIGDLNAMHGTGFMPWALRFAGRRAENRFLPVSNPGTPKPARWLSPEGVHWLAGRSVSVLRRLGGMAAGTTMQLFEDAGFTDADVSHRGTMPSRVALFQLDHVLYSAGVTVSDFTRVPTVGITDHRGLYAKATV